MKWFLIVVLISTVNDVKYVIVALLATCMSCCVKCLFMFFSHSYVVSLMLSLLYGGIPNALF